MGIEEFVPKAGTSIDNLGFLFGAGTSFESGYPLVSGLTKDVVGALSTDDRAALDEALATKGFIQAWSIAKQGKGRARGR